MVTAGAADPATDSPAGFGRAELAAALAAAGSDLAVRVEPALDPTLGEQGYRLAREPAGALVVSGGDAVGVMYGLLEVAEAVRLGTIERLRLGEHRPHVARRGIKFNLPLDLRTPSYSDASDAAQANIPVMWDESFWREFLDHLARHRYNVLSLWSLHPFPSLVRVPEFPDVALDDVWRTRAKLNDDFSSLGTDMVKPAMLADHEVVKRLTIDQKIAFWRRVMAHAKARGIDTYVFTWNVFTYGATGKHGITGTMDDPATKAYFRASVREMVRTYPLLAGFGITAGEGMPHAMDPKVKERWLWDTYGEGVRDALRDEPGRVVRMIHRFHWTAQGDIIDAWKDYPGFPATFDFSFKYSVAHMYSVPDPGFIRPLVEGIRPGLRTWLTVRNDDIYTFRFGDPDFFREYVLNMPSPAINAGFYMGPDGYVWGRSFLERDPGPGGPPLVVEKQWYSFMLMGRLAYDPSLGNAHFARVLGARFPGADAEATFEALRAAAQTMPLITRFFWGDIDLKWFPEACWSNPRRYGGFHTVRKFIEGGTMPGAGVLDIRDWRERLAARRPMAGTTPPEIADALDGAAARTLAAVAALRGAPPPRERANEFAATLDDCEALATLGRYYAAKIQGACALALFDLGGDPAERASAVRQLETALGHWRRYAAVRDARYRPALYNRAGYVDVTALVSLVEADVTMARQWQPGTVPRTAARHDTERGFRD